MCFPVTVGDLKKELDKYPDDMDVFYVNKYALVPCEVKMLDDRCVCVDMAKAEKHKYKEDKE